MLRFGGVFLAIFWLSVVVRAEYNEKLAREKFLPLASAAYSYRPEQCVENVFSDAVISAKAMVRCGTGLVERKNCFGFVGYSKKEKAIFLVYRGTNDGAQLFYEVYRTLSRVKVRSPIGGHVSKYFHDVYSAINSKTGLGTKLKYLLRKYPEYKIWVTGHSLGAALASIAAGELVGVHNVSSDRIVMINFGQPRVGDREYAEAYEKLVPKAYRVVHANDIVPHVPPALFDGYHHASREIWYPQSMMLNAKYVECPAENEDRCSPGARALSVADHISYFDTMFVLHGWSGCKPFDLFSLLTPKSPIFELLRSG